MTHSRMSLFCLVDGETLFDAFSVEIEPIKTIDGLKRLIKAKKANSYSDVDADMFRLWRVSIPIVPPNAHKPVFLTEVESATELDPTDDISDVFEDQTPKKTIHIVVTAHRK
ncbi:hypothetical protein BG003_011162, partial [Podila horticola]